MKYLLNFRNFLLLSILFGFNFANADSAMLPLPKNAQGNLLALSGSNTVGGKLAPAWAKAYLEAKGVLDVNIYSDKENEYRIQGKNNTHDVSITVKAHGSSTGFKSLLDDSAHIAMASRSIKEKELNQLQHLGNLRSYATEHVVAIDGLAIIVHSSNSLKSLSVNQLGKVFAGEISNWRELGGENKPISLYARDNKSGTWDTFRALVLKTNGYSLSTAARRFESNDTLSDLVSQDPNGIGFVGLASVRQSKAVSIIDGGTDALSPEPIFVATEDYPLSRRLYLYTPENPNSSLVSDFIRFTQENRGQNIVEKIGFISQNPVGLKITAEGGSEFYKALTEHAVRLSMNFRFQPGSAELDNKAKRDIMRLAEHLKNPQNRHMHIQLIGFSDQEKKASLAQVLSKLRASAVKRELFKYGVTTESVEGFGAERPVASKSAKNDRVEVWLYTQDKAVAIEKLKKQKERSDKA